MQNINIVGFDPSMRNWGISHMTYNNTTGLELLSVDVVTTELDKTSSKSKALQDLDACKILIEAIDNNLQDIDVIVIELPIGSQSSAAMKSYGICIALSAYASTHNIPTLFVSPFDVKKVVGKTNTTKHAIVDWVNNKHPNILSKQLYKSNHEADATVAVYAALNQIKEIYNEINTRSN